MNMVKKGVVATPIGEAGQGFSTAQKVLRMSGALRQNWRGVHPLQPERQMQPSRARLLLRQRTNFRIWKTWAGKTKQLALSPRIYGSVTTVIVPTWTHTAHPVDESYGHDASNETFYPYKSTVKGTRHRDEKTVLGIINDQ
ncbi:uncharacterized protein ACA1_150030 [Acanthamoeba castellanii str. Neff]|uniref:Uncharacterized protein n=1 Tax=Acanthamoeba castellanii (strain ATCC 30010 / Neff) TaxID=1257118 RepID=L8HDH6_ACACF|nr:uncharacterized protein ACA1_150030 [Acanthamoeba castellanii str. Neff]ELR22813.1 hypothetical protein ACA1_150030 [Acanthamoeba castellanii str. Neff]